MLCAPCELGFHDQRAYKIARNLMYLLGSVCDLPVWNRNPEFCEAKLGLVLIKLQKVLRLHGSRRHSVYLMRAKAHHVGLLGCHEDEIGSEDFNVLVNDHRVRKLAFDPLDYTLDHLMNMRG